MSDLVTRDVVQKSSSVPEERREVILRVPETAVLDAVVPVGSGLPHTCRVLTAPGLPTGTWIRAVYHDPMIRCFNFFLEHPSFDPVPDGMPAPLFPGIGFIGWSSTHRRNRWADSPPDGRVVQTDVNNAVRRLEKLVGSDVLAGTDVVVTIHPDDVYTIAVSGEVRTCVVAYGPDAFLDETFCQFGLPPWLYGCVVKVDDVSPPGIVTLSAGGRAVCFSIYEECHGEDSYHVRVGAPGDQDRTLPSPG